MPASGEPVSSGGLAGQGPDPSMDLYRHDPVA